VEGTPLPWFVPDSKNKRFPVGVWIRERHAPRAGQLEGVAALGGALWHQQWKSWHSPDRTPQEQVGSKCIGLSQLQYN